MNISDTIERNCAENGVKSQPIIWTCSFYLWRQLRCAYLWLIYRIQVRPKKT